MIFSNDSLNTKIMGDFFHEIFSGSVNSQENLSAIPMIRYTDFEATNTDTGLQPNISDKTNKPVYIRKYEYIGGFSLGNSSVISSTYDRMRAIRDGDRDVSDVSFIKIVSDKFIKTLNKIYSKYYNETITDSRVDNINGVNVPRVYAQERFLSLVINIHCHNQAPGYQTVVDFVDKLILNGDLLEEDRIDNYDIISLEDFTKLDCSLNTDTQAKTTTLRINKPQILKTTIDTLDAEQNTSGRRYYLMFNPMSIGGYDQRGVTQNYMEVKATNGNAVYPFGQTQPVHGVNWSTLKTEGEVPEYSRAPWNSFKAKEGNQYHGKECIMGSHLFLKIGTQEEYDILPNADKPDIIVDHIDKISAIDSLEVVFNLNTHVI